MRELPFLQSEIGFEAIIQHFSDVIVVLNENGIVQYESPSIERVLGYSSKDLVGSNCFDIVHYDDLHNALHLYQTIMDHPEINKNTEIRIRRKDGIWLHCEVRATNLLNDHHVRGIIVSFRDISERKKFEREIQYMANHDFLTGLPNRTQYEHQLFKQLKKYNRIAVLFIDLDRFKVINESMGHHVGDLLLIEVTNRLKSCLTKKDRLFRQGGDEFIIILSDVERDDVNNVTQMILEVLSKAITINQLQIFTSPSIGVSFFPDDGETVEEITKHADFAMYQAKAKGRNTFHFYSPGDARNILPSKMEMELHHAIAREELHLHYQPKVNLKTGELLGVEALIRWNHPEWGLISPGEFIPIAEASGLIFSIGEWALKTACKQNKVWYEKGLSTVVAVNLSARQFHQSNLVQVVEKVLEETELPPQLLELEITESMTANMEQTIVTLNKLKKLGVLISIDDFGTGFSSLNYLKDFPIDTLKIDQSFVRDISTNSNGETIVKTIIAMAHNLNLNVVAEGIETTEQLLFLQDHHCDEGQGYFICKPVQASKLEAKVQECKQKVQSVWVH
ncbi:EAL domain-containing protein [Alkalihalobacillus sp. BA299]|uniref:sensor domain-containing protein n=1 Tax=Alkalihalobacillus sp. BA299 TaxID=2815938 RepID=UPI001ADBE277|nr:EAL domain-containing protein [Alkalihalobacillus sp. BA299]